MPAQDEILYDDADILEVMNKRSQAVENFDPKDVHVETKNTQMVALINRMEAGAIDLSPEFQRRADVWKEEQQSMLIESMMLNIPIPVFYVDATDDDKWVVIDGLQRLNTINLFVVEGKLTLKGLELMPQYNSYTFSMLPQDLQRCITETDVIIYQIRRGTPPSVRYDIFSRINTGGTQLSPQEIRHALNPGRILSFLERLAGSKHDESGRSDEGKEFSAAVCEGVSPERMSDQECVLRFLAFTFAPPENYRTRDFDMFLNNAMEVGNHLSEQKLQEYAALFRRTMEVSRKVFGDKAFRKIKLDSNRRSPVNKALFEAVSVNISRLTHEQQEVLIRRRSLVIDSMTNLMADGTDFDSSIFVGTSSWKKVQYRFSAVKDLFERVLNAD